MLNDKRQELGLVRVAVLNDSRQEVRPIGLKVSE